MSHRSMVLPKKDWVDLIYVCLRFNFDYRQQTPIVIHPTLLAQVWTQTILVEENHSVGTICVCGMHLAMVHRTAAM
jgi:hypothetical protein